jgi:hypothetical protein
MGIFLFRGEIRERRRSRHCRFSGLTGIFGGTRRCVLLISFATDLLWMAKDINNKEVAVSIHGRKRHSVRG